MRSISRERCAGWLGVVSLLLEGHWDLHNAVSYCVVYINYVCVCSIFLQSEVLSLYHFHGCVPNSLCSEFCIVIILCYAYRLIVVIPTVVSVSVKARVNVYVDSHRLSDQVKPLEPKWNWETKGS